MAQIWGGVEETFTLPRISGQSLNKNFTSYWSLKGRIFVYTMLLFANIALKLPTSAILFLMEIWNSCEQIPSFHIHSFPLTWKPHFLQISFGMATVFETHASTLWLWKTSSTRPTLIFTFILLFVSRCFMFDYTFMQWLNSTLDLTKLTWSTMQIFHFS